MGGVPSPSKGCGPGLSWGGVPAVLSTLISVGVTSPILTLSFYSKRSEAQRGSELCQGHTPNQRQSWNESWFSRHLNCSRTQPCPLLSDSVNARTEPRGTFTLGLGLLSASFCLSIIPLGPPSFCFLHALLSKAAPCTPEASCWGRQRSGQSGR